MQSKVATRPWMMWPTKLCCSTHSNVGFQTKFKKCVVCCKRQQCVWIIWKVKKTWSCKTPYPSFSKLCHQQATKTQTQTHILQKKDEMLRELNSLNRLHKYFHPETKGYEVQSCGYCSLSMYKSSKELLLSSLLHLLSWRPISYLFVFHLIELFGSLWLS